MRHNLKKLAQENLKKQLSKRLRLTVATPFSQVYLKMAQTARLPECSLKAGKWITSVYVFRGYIILKILSLYRALNGLFLNCCAVIIHPDLSDGPGTGPLTVPGDAN